MQKPLDSILFVCKTNAARSQMAEALANHLFGDAVHVVSAGQTRSSVHPMALRAIEELDLHMDGHEPKTLEDVVIPKFDIVVNLCKEGIDLTEFARAEHLHWPIFNPIEQSEGLGIEQAMVHFRAARDQIYLRLQQLITHLSKAGGTQSTPGNGNSVLGTWAAAINSDSLATTSG